MKKFPSLILAILLVFGLFGCKEPEPEPTYTIYYDKMSYILWLEDNGDKYNNLQWRDIPISQEKWDDCNFDLSSFEKKEWTQYEYGDWWKKTVNANDNSVQELIEYFFTPDHCIIYFRYNDYMHMFIR